MTYAIIKIINGNYFVHAEGFTDLTAAKIEFHGLCRTLWNASDVYTGCVAIVNENLEVASDDLYISSYKEYITHEQPETNSDPAPEE